MADKIAIEVCYAIPEKQSLLEVLVPKDSTVQQGIEQSGILNIHSDIELDINKVGIWSRVCKLDTILSEGDRIEIYRPLIADPKEVRKMRAQRAKEEGRADKVTGGRVTNKDKTEANKNK
ncbi:RnfH family protein [Agaribacter flavus]|uniref:UPF0125 protein ACFOHL_00185 n=1 Tax=Agaribacter flavus TaxID=1902781 RepID=A0ABV7FIC6_9ALTE